MAIRRVGGTHLEMTCDGCSNRGPMAPVSEAELLARAETNGWDIDRELGLHYCFLHTVHDCASCGTPTRNMLGDQATGTVSYYCDDCFDEACRPDRGN